jgi:hypothetical protein
LDKQTCVDSVTLSDNTANWIGNDPAQIELEMTRLVNVDTSFDQYVSCDHPRCRPRLVGPMTEDLIENCRSVFKALQKGLR